MADFRGRVAPVTGSSSGIGAAIAEALAARGAKVVINSSKSVDAGEQLASKLPHVIYVQGDIGDPPDAAELVDRAVAQFGRHDIVVNNAGTTEVISHGNLTRSPTRFGHAFSMSTDRNVACDQKDITQKRSVTPTLYAGPA